MQRRFRVAEDIKRSIITHLYQLHRRMRRESDSSMGVENLTLHQMQALFFVKHNQPVRMGELADELRISPGSASLLADRLVESGWLSRTQDENDRRGVCLELSAETGQKMNRMMKKNMENAGRLLDALLPKEQQELDRLLKKLGE